MDGRNCRYVEAQVIRFRVLDDNVGGVIDKAWQALAKEIHAGSGTIDLVGMVEVRDAKSNGPANIVDGAWKLISVPNFPYKSWFGFWVGVNNILTKRQGSKNIMNLVRATLNALIGLKDAVKIANKRGISIQKVFS